MSRQLIGRNPSHTLLLSRSHANLFEPLESLHFDQNWDSGSLEEVYITRLSADSGSQEQTLSLSRHHTAAFTVSQRGLIQLAS
ncbi:hypothetical protein CEXT_303111 [Caerostris extrusa]|uniref:Uncharacterized protein n=1 Tax=Caerostris extrusa TaxID=172846 RepID=A0AAV4NC37_CAEEX|nr:hypothetical protein CEXT_509451 [Caerostris extrusa]GIY50065.1 hypothetical protein CEXT_303111 [Caerostris extrusa]